MTLQAQGGTPDELRAALRQAEQDRAKPNRRSKLVREEFANVTMNIWPALIPKDSIDAGTLLAALASEFGASLDGRALLKGVPGELVQKVSDHALLSHALANDSGSIAFQGGHLTDSNSNRVTPIRKVSFGSQTLNASVSGTSDEAEYLCKRLAVILSTAAGVKRLWPDFEPHVELVSYASSTVVDLGAPISKILSPKFARFLEEDIAGAAGFGRRMGMHGNKSASEQATLSVLYGMQEVEFVVYVSDTVSGRSDKCTISMINHTQSDLNRSRVKVLTELRSSDHDALIERLANALA